MTGKSLNGYEIWIIKSCRHECHWYIFFVRSESPLYKLSIYSGRHATGLAFILHLLHVCMKKHQIAFTMFLHIFLSVTALVQILWRCKAKDKHLFSLLSS